MIEGFVDHEMAQAAGGDKGDLVVRGPGRDGARQHAAEVIATRNGRLIGRIERIHEDWDLQRHAVPHHAAIDEAEGVRHGVGADLACGQASHLRQVETFRGGAMNQVAA